MVPGRPRLGSILIKNRVVSAVELHAAVQFQVQNACRLGEALLELGFCSEAELARGLAEQLEIPFVDLSEDRPQPQCVAMIPRDVALEHGVLPIRMDGDRLLVVARNPFDIRVDEAVRQVCDVPVIVGIAAESQLREVLQHYYTKDILSHSSAGDIEQQQEEEEAEFIEQNPVETLTSDSDSSATVRLVNALITDAVRRGASDMHIEPEDKRVRVRYRVDGVLTQVLTFRRFMLPSMVARLKIMCSMDIADNRKPQDGACQVRVDGRDVQLRASTLRGVYGEMVVLRILSTVDNLQRLDLLGFAPDILRSLKLQLNLRQGIFLVTGPTGSGKTTTLGAALNHINEEAVNIMTVEDPVEMKLDRINQVQVDEKAGRSFATTLRSMLRQDPDIIMVGEIRDLETAEIACRAALTGHFVLSTLHTQHTLGTLTRLSEMGVAPWLVGSALNGVLAQRLVRRNCPACARTYTPPSGLLRALKSQFGSLGKATFKKGEGCHECHGAGMRGRVGVYELLAIDETFRHMVAEEARIDDLRSYAEKRGFRTMEQDAFQKACTGVIPPEEVMRLGLSVLVDEEEEPPAPEASEPLPDLPPAGEDYILPRAPAAALR